MRGLLVVGASLEAGALEVAAAACAAAELAGEPTAPYAPLVVGPEGERGLGLLAEAAGRGPGDLGARRPGTPASPMVAARHAGIALEPAALVEEALAAASTSEEALAAADRLLIGALPGTLLSPLTPRYSVRDLVRDLALPLVLAARSDPDALGHLRLAREAARAEGLAVPAVVLTGWPEPPSRVLLDEREAIEDLMGVAVHALPGGARTAADLAVAAAEWPLDRWVHAAFDAASRPPGDSSAGGGDVPVVLDPYEAWEPRTMPDPRHARRDTLDRAMLEIIAREGPMTAARAYALYNRAAGGRKLTSIARAPLSSSAYRLAKDGRVVLRREEEVPWQGGDLLRLPDTAAVRVRELGPRGLEEVPVDEIAALMRRLRAARGVAGATALKRAVLSAYGLVRLTARADEYLGRAVALAQAESAEEAGARPAEEGRRATPS